MMRFFIVLLAIFNMSVIFSQQISDAFQDQTTPATPDYNLESSWSSLPWIEDTADETPIKSQIKDNQSSAQIDVFYIHPTTLMTKAGTWNASIDDEKLNKGIDNWPIRHQASVFNGSSRVFAPRYRQANYEAFMTLGEENSTLALDLAYTDIEQAFAYYLENWNQGRPFIIAGHSQGAYHAIRLIAEEIDTTQLLEQMVVAYLVGMPVMENQYQNCPPCQEENDTHCFITWNTMKKGNYPDFYEMYYSNAICHNPLSWTTESTYVSKDEHKGGVGRKFKKVYTHKYGAKIKNGILWVDPVNIPGIPFTKLKKNWHIGDYNLFYINIRENVANRTAHFLEQK